MDFDSPDVAKDFPGLAMALSEVNEYDDWDKSKKKKEKKDTKKDKDKGYAALNDSPDEDEETKSPGKSIKIKTFKLTSKKKDKKETVLPREAEKERAKSLSSEMEKSILRDVQFRGGGGATASIVVESAPLSSAEQPTTQRKPFDGQGYKPTSNVSSKTSKKLQQIAGSSINYGGAPQALTSTSSSFSNERKGLNVFLNAPVPLLLKKKIHKEKETKNEHDLSGSKVKLKLKKSSKSRHDEGTANCGNAASSNQSMPSSHLPEDPDTIAKEIKKYETLLEQAHAHVKSGKKVSKKAENQLWELQMTLTQLKRKLRSVNALSASFASPHYSATSAWAKSSSPSVSSDSGMHPVCSQNASYPNVDVDKNVSIPPITSAHFEANSAEDTFNALSKENMHVQLQDVPMLVSPLTVVKNSETIIVSKVEVSALEISEQVESKNSCASSEFANLPAINKEEKRDTIQVQVEVHSNDVANENPTPEDMYEQEITSFNKTEAGLNASLGKRENIEKGRRFLNIQVTPESNKSKSGDPPSTAGNESAAKIDSVQAVAPDVDDGDYVFLKTCPHLHSTNEELTEDENYKDKDQVPPTKKFISAPSIFDPFALPAFKTDEFIAAENEALIRFTQELQDEIVQEEEQIQILICQIQEFSSGAWKTNSYLMDLDDDELVNLWQTVKFENDTLNEKVLNLKIMVANSRLEEFKLETRVKYLAKMREFNSSNQEGEFRSVST